MRIEVCVIENNPASMNGNNGAVWTEIFDNELAAEQYIREVDAQEEHFTKATGVNVTYTVLAMVYFKDITIPRLEIVEYPL